ncbi:kinase-like domain-containing protein [Suillus lakei]|nr:kinase-like domain-containing protein [Suillus lakei]
MTMERPDIPRYFAAAVNARNAAFNFNLNLALNRQRPDFSDHASPPTSQIHNPQTHVLSNLTAIAEQAAPGSTPDSPQDLTNELQGRSRYRITSGGFGDIWKCDLVKPDGTVQVAVKTIRAFESDNEVLMRKNNRRVRRELKVWGRLKHDSILPLWGVADDFGPYPAMVCPWADHGALTGFLERQQDMLSSQDKFSLLNDIALGLQYLHSESVVHGDLTGSNVLIYRNGRACLADFGLSTIILEFTGASYLQAPSEGISDGQLQSYLKCQRMMKIKKESRSVPSATYTHLAVSRCRYSTCKVPYYNVKKDIAVLGQVIKGMKPEPPKESHITPGHWEFIQRCWLSRASRPSVAEIATFVACERQALSF